MEMHYTAQDPLSLSLQDKIKSGFNYLGYIYYYKKKEAFKVLEPGDAAILSFFEPGDFIHAVESTPGQGSLFSRSAGSFCQVISKVQEIEKENFNAVKEIIKDVNDNITKLTFSQKAIDGNVKSLMNEYKNYLNDRLRHYENIYNKLDEWHSNLLEQIKSYD